VRSVVNNTSKKDDKQKPDGQHIQGGDAFMHQNLIDHHLEENRRQQGEQLDEKRRGQNFQQKTAILDDGRDKPGNVELTYAFAQPRPPGNQDDFAGPCFEKFSFADYLRRLVGRVVYQNFVIGQAANNEVTAVVMPSDGRQLHFPRQPAPVGFYCARFQFQRLGGAQNRQRIERFVMLPELVPQRAGIGRTFVQPRQHDQTGQPAIEFLI
jgi:hypothetical protein